MPITTRARALTQAIDEGGEGVGRRTSSVEEAQGSVVRLADVVPTHQHGSKQGVAAASGSHRDAWGSLSFATWNSWGLSGERLRYVEEDLGYDITILTELHGRQTADFASSDPRFFGSAASTKRDPAAGVGIVLSPRMLGVLTQ